jgi:phage terminase large subunit-like protein
MKIIGIDRALTDPHLLGAALGDAASWQTWFAVLKAAFGIALSQAECRAFMMVAGNRNPPDRRVREVFAIIGRHGGKSRMAAAIAVYIATCIDHSRRLAVGDPGMVLVLAATRSQAKVVFDYIAGFLQASPLLAQQIEVITADEVRLKGNIVIAVHSNSFRSVRGRTLIAAVFDETRSC